MLIFIGTQSTEAGQGIAAARLDETSGQLTSLGAVAAVERPTCVLTDPRRPVLYAVSEVGNVGDRMAEVLSFAIADDDGRLDLISRAPSGGSGATHLALEPRGNRLFVANFGGGEAAVLPIGAGGELGAPLCVRTGYGQGPHRRQSRPHAHGVTLDPARRFLLVPDMGADRIFVYGYDGETAALEPADPPFSQLPAGAGPRLVLFGADGRFAYLLTELSAEIFVFRWDEAAGRLDAVGSTALDGQTVPETRSAAAFAMSKDGRFLYASNRRTAMIHVYSIAPMSGLLSERQQISAGGDRPWCAELSPDERWMVVANQASNTIRSFGVDLDSGLLTEAGSAEIPIPTGVAFFPEAVVGALPMAPALQGVI